MPPLQPGLPIVWDPSVVVFALASQLRRCGLVGRIPHGLLDELVSPWGCRRVAQTRQFKVPCDCGRMVLRLLLTPAGWGCSRCAGTRTRLEVRAACLLFALRLGLRGEFATMLHGRVVRLLVGRLPPQLGPRRFVVVQAATVVVSYDPHTWEARRVPGRRCAWQELGAVGRALGSELLQTWLDEWANPAAYRVRCRGELAMG